MKNRLSPWNLGATLYMPATREDIADAVLHGKIPGLRSLVICLEDAVSEADIPVALKNLEHLLHELSNSMHSLGKNDWPLVFIRPRHADMGRWLKAHYDLSAVDGFVLPKFTLSSLAEWWDIMGGTHLCMMPTLETEDVFDVAQMRELATRLVEHPCHDRIIALRIGGNDLMNVVSLRRPRDLTLYDSPMGYVIKMLVSVFGPRDFALTAPVCEHIDHTQLLMDELCQDMNNGIYTKTAIHPSQIEYIHRAFQINSEEFNEAQQILAQDAKSVFKSHGSMLEPATHRNWAEMILLRYKTFGLSKPQALSQDKFMLNTFSL